MTSKKDKKPYTVLNYIKHLLVLVFAFSECVSISAFVSLVGVFIDSASSAVGLKGFAVTPGIKKYKSIIKKKKKKYDKKVLLAKNKLSIVKVWISKAFIDLCISQYEFILLNVLKNMMM